MEKLGIKPGTKLDLQIDISGGGGAEFKSSFAQENGGGACLIAIPIKEGKSFLLDEFTALSVTYLVGESTYTFHGHITGTAKKGPRTYLALQATNPPEKHERRVFARVAAELDAEITVFQHNSDNQPMHTFAAKTGDVSQGGLSLYTNAEIPVGEMVGVKIYQEDPKAQIPKSDLPLQVKVCWNRSAPKGVGFNNSIGVQFLFRNGGEIKEVERLFFSLNKEH